MMGIEEALLSRIVITGDLRGVRAEGINEFSFLDHRNRGKFKLIEDYFESAETIGSVPSLDYVRLEYEDFALEESPQTTEAMCHELRERTLANRLNGMCLETMQDSMKDPHEAYHKLKKGMEIFQNDLTKSWDISMLNGFDYLLRRYLEVKEKKGVIGIPWPFPTLTTQSGGIQTGNFIVIYGRQKSMKTWSLLFTAINAFLAYGKRVVFFTWEMPPEDLMWRAACIFGGVDYEDWNRGKLTTAQEKRMFEDLYFLHEMERRSEEDLTKPALVFTTDLSTKGGGVSSLRAKINQLKPDLVIADGFYNMKDDRDRKHSVKWKNQTHVTHDLHAVSQEVAPVIGSTQANRTGIDPLDERDGDMGFTDQVVRLCSYLIKNYLYEIEDETYLFCRFKDSRDFRYAGIKVKVKPGLVFEEVAAYKKWKDMREDMKEAKEKSEEEQEKKKKAKGRGGAIPSEILAKMGEWSKKKDQ